MVYMRRKLSRTVRMNAAIETTSNSAITLPLSIRRLSKCHKLVGTHAATQTVKAIKAFPERMPSMALVRPLKNNPITRMGRRIIAKRIPEISSATRLQ